MTPMRVAAAPISAPAQTETWGKVAKFAGITPERRPQSVRVTRVEATCSSDGGHNLWQRRQTTTDINVSHRWTTRFRDNDREKRDGGGV
jgi:hypothetical protein